MTRVYLSPTISSSLLFILLLPLFAPSTAAPQTDDNAGADIHTPHFASVADPNLQIGPKHQPENATDHSELNAATAAHPAAQTVPTVQSGASDPANAEHPSEETATLPEEDPDTATNASTDATHPAAEELADDAEVLSEMRARVERLLERQRALDEELAGARRERVAAASARADAAGRMLDAHPARGRAAAALRAHDHRLAALRAELPVYFENLRALADEAGRGQREIARLRAERRHLLLLQRRLVAEFRARGLEAWIQGALRGALRAAPGRVAAVDRQLGGGADAGRGGAGPMFALYSGLVSYLVVLLPAVLVASVIARVRRRFLRLGLGHWIVLGNVYFGVLSVGCFIASQFGAVDVLVTIQRHRFHFYNLALVAHGAVYAVHVLCHVIYAASARTARIALHALGVSAVGAHFYIHSYRHALRGEAPDVDPRAYFIYATVFFYILFELVFRKLIAAASAARAKQGLPRGTLLHRIRGVFQRAVTPRAKTIHPIPGGEALLSNSNHQIVDVSVPAMQDVGATGTEGRTEQAGQEFRPCVPGGALGTVAGAVAVDVDEGESKGLIRPAGTRLGAVSGEIHSRHDTEAAKTL